MRALVLRGQDALDHARLAIEEVQEPAPQAGHVRIRVHVCALCHTDLHVIEGDIPAHRLPLVPGHQVVGVVDACGEGVTCVRPGQRVGVPWLHETCGKCRYCLGGAENLCENARFTGYDVDGGYAEVMIARDDAVYPVPEGVDGVQAAPLLCAGVIGYRALKRAEISAGKRVGLFGFGASAHIALQIARHRGCEVFVFSRSAAHRRLAENLGAAWTGGGNDIPPHPLDSAVVFAPAGSVVPVALRVLDKGGTIALAGIHMSPIPEMPYALLYGERTLRSVANSTHNDVRELLALAPAIPVKTEVEEFGFDEIRGALGRLKNSALQGSGVVRMREEP